MSDELASLRTKCSSTEARLSAAHEQVESAKEEAAESKRKHDLAIKEIQITVENITALKERAIQQAQEREDSLRAEFSATVAGKENKIQESLEMLEEAEKMQSGLRNRLKVQEAELVTLREEVKDLREKLNVSNSNIDLTERNFQMLEQDRSYLQQRLAKQVKWSKELEQKYDIAETDAKRAAEVAKKAQNDAEIAQTEKIEFQRVVKQRLAEIEGVEKHLETLEREKADLIRELERVRKSEQDAASKVAFLESGINEREREVEQFCQSTAEQRESTVQMLESLLATERAERLAETQNAEKRLETLEREKANLIQEVERVRKSEEDAVSKVAYLESRINERDKEVKQLLQSTAEQRESTVQVLENLLATERASNAEANTKAEALSVQLELTQGKLDALQQERSAAHLNEKVMDKPKTAIRTQGKLDALQQELNGAHLNEKVMDKPKTAIRTRRATRNETKNEQGIAVGFSVRDVVNVAEETVELSRKRTRRANIEIPTVKTRRNNNNNKVEMPANSKATSVVKPGDDPQMTARKDSHDYTKLTIAKLKQELANQGFASELLQLRNPIKKDILALYEKLILKR